MYKGIIDTSVIVRFLTEDSPDKKRKFKELINEATQEKTVLLIPLMVVIELVYVLDKVYKLDKNDVREKAESLITLPAVEIEGENIMLEALRLYEEENLKFGDAMLIAKSRVSNIRPIYTFDKKDFKKYQEAHIL